MRPRKGELISKPDPGPDRGLQLALVKPKSLVVAGHHLAANTFLLLAHTARQANRVEFWQASGFCRKKLDDLILSF
jgi:hypothetical protein